MDKREESALGRQGRYTLRRLNWLARIQIQQLDKAFHELEAVTEQGAVAMAVVPVAGGEDLVLLRRRELERLIQVVDKAHEVAERLEMIAEGRGISSQELAAEL